MSAYLTRSEAWVGEVWDWRYQDRPRNERTGGQITFEVHRPDSQEVVSETGLSGPTCVVYRGDEMLAILTEPQVYRLLNMLKAADSKRNG